VFQDVAGQLIWDCQQQGISNEPLRVREVQKAHLTKAYVTRSAHFLNNSFPRIDDRFANTHPLKTPLYDSRTADASYTADRQYLYARIIHKLRPNYVEFSTFSSPASPTLALISTGLRGLCTAYTQTGV